MIKNICLILFSLGLSVGGRAQIIGISGPDGLLKVTFTMNNGQANYDVKYNSRQIMESSPLGIVTSAGDFGHNLVYTGKEEHPVEKMYQQTRIKKLQNHYTANEVSLNFENEKKQKFRIIFRVSNNDIALKYSLPKNGSRSYCTVERELTGFRFPKTTTTFLTPQAPPMSGWENTKPSYEEEYIPDQPMGTASKYGLGYTFPGLFHIPEAGWALVSETGVRSLYCGSRLSEGNREGLYTVSFPEPGENNGIGSAAPSLALPGETPWRTITVGESLKPVVETTIPFDLVEPLYQPSREYRSGRSTWSWLLWQDASINYEDQKKFIDLSATLGYEFVLIDGWWDKTIGRDKMKELLQYAASRNVGIFLWYNSNGFWNNAPQTPKNRMNTSISRKEEMEWMKSLGIKGIKVDFFGGDKQETMKLYEDILSDANDHGLAVIFHGCTLPRGWDRMYPNFVGAEAVLASENLYFTQHANDFEAYNATLHPFIRNTVASMDFGPVLLNQKHNRENNGGTERRTTEIFQLATAVLFQASVQNFGITPNNLTECPDFVIDFMKKVPTTWEETIFIDGYPGKYVVLARKSSGKWYITGINAEKESKKLKLKLPMLADKNVVLYSDKKDRTSRMEKKKISKNGEIEVSILSGGGMIITGE